MADKLSSAEEWQREFDDHEEDDNDGWDECGRWDNGTLTMQCSKAGSEECDWHCPIGLPRRQKRAVPLT